MTNKGIPELMTTEEVMRALRIRSKTTLYRRPYRYVLEGGRRLYFAEDIRRSLLLNAQKPETRESR